MGNLIELEASEVLLDIGVSLPIKEMKLFGKRFVFRFTMKRPYLGSQIRIARKYLQLGTTYEQMKNFTKDEEMKFLAQHGKTLSEMVALTICRGAMSVLFSGAIAWFLRWRCEDEVLNSANRIVIHCIGTRNFTNIIRSSEWSNPLKPRLSQARKGS